jgi:hypothetical protein
MEARELKNTEVRVSNLVQNASGGYQFEVTPEMILEPYGLYPIPLTEEWLLKFGFENWGLGSLFNNKYESYNRYVLFNVLDGTSNFEIHYIKSTYGNTEDYEFVISCDEDERLNWGSDIKHVHQLQNLYFALTGEEL